MLTSSWGRGKSFYIDNCLIKSLGKERCVKVSLYGLKHIEDISKAIYFEIRAKKWQPKKNEQLTAFALAGRTVVRGILSYFKINLKPQEEELQSLYNSIDLSEKLIIFEDVERSDIPIVDIMGYVNNLCEQDGLKVLLVANEAVIESADKAEEYYKIKEKTVIDTITFNCDIEDPVKNILDGFAVGKNNFVKILKEKDSGNKSITVKKISAIMQEDAKTHKGNGYNLRSLIFACQKTEDLFREVDSNKIIYSQDVFEACFFGIIAFSLKFKRGYYQDKKMPLIWKNDLDSPAMLGCEAYPLLKVCYDYIKEQKFDCVIFRHTVEDYPQLKIKESNWRKLNNYPEYSFNELLDAIKVISNLIENGTFPLEECGTLVYTLFSIKATLGKIDLITHLLDLIKKELKKGKFCPYEVYSKITNPTAGMALTKETVGDYDEYKKEIAGIIVQKALKELVSFTVDEAGISQFHRLIDEYESGSYELFNSIRKGFAAKLDVEKLADSLVKCPPQTISNFCKGFEKLYNFRDSGMPYTGNAKPVIKEKTINELFEELPRQFKDGSEGRTYLSDDDKEAIEKFKAAFERKYDVANAEKSHLANKDETILKLIDALNSKIGDDKIDPIVKHHLVNFIGKLKNIYN